MTSKIINQEPYLRTSRNIPFDLQPLVVEINRLYTDIAQKMNARTIGLYPTNNPAITGDQWFLSGTSQKQQTLRQVYPFGAIASGAELDIPTGLQASQITAFTRIYGTVVTNQPDYRPLPYVDPGTLSVSMTILVGQVSGKQQIRIVLGATAPAVTSGYAVLEWLSDV